MKYILLILSLTCFIQVDALNLSLIYSDQDTGKNKKLDAGIDSVSATGNEIIDPSPIMEFNLDEPAKFKGGMDSLSAVISENIKYPDSLMALGIAGRTIVQFIVEKDGSISNIKIQKSSGYNLFDEEAIRVIQLLNGRFIPAQINGKPVRAYCLLPIEFEYFEDE